MDNISDLTLKEILVTAERKKWGRKENVGWRMSSQDSTSSKITFSLYSTPPAPPPLFFFFFLPSREFQPLMKNSPGKEKKLRSGRGEGMNK